MRRLIQARDTEMSHFAQAALPIERKCANRAETMRSHRSFLVCFTIGPARALKLWGGLKTQVFLRAAGSRHIDLRGVPMHIGCVALASLQRATLDRFRPSATRAICS